MRALVFCFVLLVAACATPASAGPALSGTSWTVATISGADAGAAQRRPSVAFTDTRVSGSAGCNAWSGNYTLTGDALHITQGVHTMMACASGMEVERAFLDAVENTRRASVSGATLTFFDAQGHVLATFSRAS